MSILNPQFDRYRLVLISPRTRKVLLEENVGTLSLPQLLVPRWTRAARSITTQIKERWNTRATIVDFLGDHPGGGNVVIAADTDALSELFTSDSACYPLRSVPASELSKEERAVIGKLLEKGSTDRGPFSRTAWIEELLVWTSKELRLERWRLSDEVVQLNAAAADALVHISSTRDDSYWFKASGGSHPHERSITATLARSCPAYVPEIVASHEEWNGWLMRDAGLPLLSLASLSDQAVEVMKRLGKLQVATASCVQELLLQGAHDHRLPILRAQISELLPSLEEAMLEPDEHVGARIDAARLRQIAGLIREATQRLEDIGIPDTLIHCDIGFENILAGPEGCVFIDWAHAGVGHPFITLENLCSQFAQHHEVRNLIPLLQESYLRVWEDRLSLDRLREALAFAPLVALASLLCCRRDWLTGGQRRWPSFQSYARVMARQMDLAAQRIQEVRYTSAAAIGCESQRDDGDGPTSGSEMVNSAPFGSRFRTLTSPS